MDSFLLVVLVLLGMGFFSLRFFLRGNSSKIKGWFGEKKISNRLKKLESDKYIVLNDLLLKTEDGNTSQIDHLVISAYGIFVIETKNYKGWIFGNEKSDNWTQAIYSKKNYFRNPVKQNWSHIYALKSILKCYNNVRYIPVVVFTGSAVLKNIVSNAPVIYGCEVRKWITEYPVENCVTLEEMKKIASVLQNENMKGKEIRKEHVRNIHKTVFEKQCKMEKLICPRCNGELKVRNGKTGKFYGCSNYPRCKFTLPYLGSDACRTF